MSMLRSYSLAGLQQVPVGFGDRIVSFVTPGLDPGVHRLKDFMRRR